MVWFAKCRRGGGTHCGRYTSETIKLILQVRKCLPSLFYLFSDFFCLYCVSFPSEEHRRFPARRCGGWVSGNARWDLCPSVQVCMCVCMCVIVYNHVCVLRFPSAVSVSGAPRTDGIHCDGNFRLSHRRVYSQGHICIHTCSLTHSHTNIYTHTSSK